RRDDQKGQLLQKAADEIKKHRKQLLALHGRRVRDIAERLRGLEGIAATVYFKALSDVLQENYRFAGRSQHPAADPFNAFLNYGFAILYSKTEAALRLAGIHPQIGFLHRDDYKRKSMLYDFIEPFRVYVEKVVFQLFSKKMVGANHTVATANGVHLGQEGIQLLVERLNAFMDEKKEAWNEQNVSRDRFVKLSAVHTAKRFLELGDAETVEILMDEFAN
ncbi:MAG: CRISPR-associated endonuclease Cas1, partial [Saprospiraceae bacterium]|nr:CRISPR-associated endonuclease Cas1 [Saprospiraceae bacterium]